MLMPDPRQVVQFTVRPDGAGEWSVTEQGFDKPIAAFADADSAEQYALRLAESKFAWKVDVYDSSRKLLTTYNSKDVAMPRPAPE